MGLSDLSAELIRRQLPCGGWSALVSSVQPALEPTCYSLLAVGSQATDVRERAHSFLLRAQNPNGSWPVFAGDDHDGSWVTSLVAIALRDLVPAIPARLKGLHWLLSSADTLQPAPTRLCTSLCRSKPKNSRLSFRPRSRDRCRYRDCRRDLGRLSAGSLQNRPNPEGAGNELLGHTRPPWPRSEQSR